MMETRRRALFAFDIAGNIPAGATVVSATFNLDVVGVRVQDHR
jgi:hypothetical protein